MKRPYLIALVSMVFLLVVPAFAAAETPAYLPVQAFLTDADDVPVDGDVELEFTIYDAATGGEDLYNETVQVTANAGAVTAYLGENQELDLELFGEHEELYLGVRIDGGEELEPRQRLATVPYAAHAANAESAESATKLDGRDPEEFEPNEYTAASPLSEDEGEFGLEACDSDGHVLKMNGDAWECAPDERSTAGDGLQENSGEMSVDTSYVQRRVSESCDGQNGDDYVVGIESDGSVVCGEDADSGGTITEVASGEGLSGGSTSGTATLKVSDGGITSSKLDNGAVSSSKIESGAVGSSELSSGAVTSSELASDSVTSSKIDDGTITNGDISSTADISGDKLDYGGDSLSNYDFEEASDCPAGDVDGPQCDEVPPGSYCEYDDLDDISNGLDGSLDNCGSFDWYFRTD
ncbi:MAG: hypothetical protein ACOCV2_10130 [Persicimonas sp.]